MEFASGQVGRLLEGINRITTDGAVLNIVVPNMALIAQMILDYEQNNKSYTPVELANKKLIINTECTNCKSDPHGSVWTPSLAKEYIEGEGTWKINQIEPKINFAGRDIYMRIQCVKTNKDT
jgi:cbb3-type cytochrome oxidase cytochrome c subunit